MRKKNIPLLSTHNKNNFYPTLPHSILVGESPVNDQKQHGFSYNSGSKLETMRSVYSKVSDQNKYGQPWKKKTVDEPLQRDWLDWNPGLW